MADLYTKVLRIRLTEAQYSAMALQAAAEGHSGISNWARAHLVVLLVRPGAPVQVSVLEAVEPLGTLIEPERVVPVMGVVEPDLRPTINPKPSMGVSLFTDDEMKAILDEALQDKD